MIYCKIGGEYMARPTVVRMLGLGKKIKRYRTDANITQRKMAKLLGIPYSTYSNYENDNRTPDTDTLDKICNILHISMSDLIGPVVGPMGGDDTLDRVRELAYNPIIPFTPENMATMLREHDLITSFRKLNIAGQNEAAKRVEELTEIPRYRAQQAPQSPPAPQEGKEDATPPSDAPETPPEGE